MSTLLTTRDVQRLINVDKSTIYRMAEAGRLPAIKVGRQWRFPADAIERWLAGNGADPGTEGLADVLSPTTLNAVVEWYADAYGVMAIATDMAGHPLTEVANPCGFFSAVAQSPEAVEYCTDGWRRLGTGGGLEPKPLVSHLGFVCARAFVRSGRELAGMLIAGGIAPTTWPPPSEVIERISTDLAIPVSDLAEHVDEVYRVDEIALARVLTGLSKTADLISTLAAERSRLTDALGQIATLARTPAASGGANASTTRSST